MAWYDFNRDNDFDWEDPVLGVSGAIISPFFALGAGVNELTGGESPTYNVWSAARDSTGTVYSDTTQALSGYQGSTPGSGEWNIPVLNPATARVAGDIVDTVLEETIGFDLNKLFKTALVLGAAFLFSREV